MAVRPTSCPGRGQPDWMLATGGWSIVGLARLARRLPSIGLPLTLRDDPQLSRFLPAPPVNSSEFAHECLIWRGGSPLGSELAPLVQDPQAQGEAETEGLLMKQAL